MKTTVSAYRSFARLLLLTGLLLLNASLAAAELKEGEGAPAFSAVLLDGATFDSASHRVLFRSEFLGELVQALPPRDAGARCLLPCAPCRGPGDGRHQRRSA